MAATVDIPSAGNPWNLVYRLAEAQSDSAWLLAGGLMVDVHAKLAGLESRPTTDADFLIDIVSECNSATRLQRVLEKEGFQLQPGTFTSYTTRMVAPENGSTVDLLVADHLPKNLQRYAKFAGDSNPVLPMPGGAQALQRRMEVVLRDHQRQVTIFVPNVLGALILKGAAWQNDHLGHQGRHLQDAALLASIIEDPDREAQEHFSRNDRRRLRILHDELPEDSQHWAYLDADRRQAGIDALQVLANC
ncbi:hypothetical protein KIMH_13050 [Bombiscardovia apis]|uniref:Uncharacterized protein n=1 Tax=Bombiscardovia apis TaxID=2932182 RepID=A0ABN6SHF3_9BIFI|nr:hypothetical protein [Bombiscardovia apis]BDR55194.1 hypothetical protein KIMH_13050 [Bombiscardovia apis]